MEHAQTVARIIGLACVIASTIVSPGHYELVIRSDIQIILAAVIVFTLIFIDHIFGFLLGLAVLVLYSRVFMNKYGISGFGFREKQSSYITPQNLIDAQTNVIAKENEAYVGVKGPYGEEVYSAQGIESGSKLPGFSPTIGFDVQNSSV